MNNFSSDITYGQPHRFTRLQQIVFTLLIGLGIALIGLTLATQPAHAQSGPQTWHLEAVRYDTGATASGSFKYDADTDTYSEINITISGSPVNGTTNSYAFPNPISLGNASFLPAVTAVQTNMIGVKAMTLSFASALTNAGGTVEILPGQTNPSFQGTCNFNCQLINGPYDLVVTGRVTTGVADNTPPNAAPTPTPFPNAAGWHNTDVTVTWNWQDNPGGSGIDQNNCPSTGASSGEGTVAITGTCNDLAGNIGNASYTVQIDKTPPDTTFSVTPQTSINLVEVTFEFSGSDDRSGLASFECQIDGGGFSPCTSPKTYNFDPINATHVFEARAVDVAGNRDQTPINHTWQINPLPAFIRIVQDTVPDGPQDFTYNATENTVSFIPGTFSLDDDVDGALSNIIRFSELVKGTYIFTQTIPPGYGPPSISCTDPSGGTSVAGNTATIHALFGETIECTFTNNLTDTTPPTASPTQSPIPNPAGWHNTDVTVTWNWIDNAGGAGIDPNSCPVSDTITLEGPFTLTPTCQDLVGNQGGTQLTVQVDKTAPDTTITSNPPATSNAVDASFEFSGSDTLSGIASLECQLDGGGFSACTSPQNFIGLANGSHTFEVRSIDVADNVDASPASYTWTVDVPPADTTPPTAAPTQSPAANSAFWNNTDVTITWNWADEAGGSGIDVNNCPASSIVSAEGIQYFPGICQDLAGNSGLNEYLLGIDKSAPDTAISTNPPATSTSADATFEFSGSDALSGVASLECQLDGGGYSPCTSPQNFIGLVNGSHTFEVRSIDVADNMDATPASYTWTVDIPPADTTPTTAAPTQSPAANGAGWNNGDVTVTWNWTDSGSGIDANNCTTSNTSNGEGSIDLTASCTDLAGNTGNASATVQVDKVAPDTTITANPPAISNTADATFEFSGSDALSGMASLECQLDGGGFSPCTSPQTYTGLANGSHTIDVRSIDVADNVDATPASYTWTVNVASTPFATCGGYDIFETAPGVYSAPSFAGNLIVGTNGKDSLVGTGGPDLIVGLDQADDIKGKGGDDVLCGDKGSDIIDGGNGLDILYGGAGKDILKGGKKADYLNGNGGEDTLNGNNGADVLYGSGGNDTINGNGGKDDLFGNNGDDTLDGGAGNDDCNGGGGNDSATNCETSVSASGSDNATHHTEEAADDAQTIYALLVEREVANPDESSTASQQHQIFLPLVSND